MSEWLWLIAAFVFLGLAFWLPSAHQHGWFWIPMVAAMFCAANGDRRYR